MLRETEQHFAYKHRAAFETAAGVPNTNPGVEGGFGGQEEAGGAGLGQKQDAAARGVFKEIRAGQRRMGDDGEGERGTGYFTRQHAGAAAAESAFLFDRRRGRGRERRGNRFVRSRCKVRGAMQGLRGSGIMYAVAPLQALLLLCTL